jgi:spore maturation protein CgeB
VSRGLTIGFFGSSLVSTYWNGAATYYRGIIRALAERGHRVTFYEPDAYDRQRHRDIADPDWARVVVYDPNDPGAVARHIGEAAGNDIVVKASGVGVLDRELEAAVAALKRPSVTTIFWDVDAPATLERLASDPHDPWRSLVRHYDLVLTYGGGEPVVAAYRALGARNCVPIYNALDPTTHFPVSPASGFSADLALLANRLPDREARIDEFFLRPAAATPGRRFMIGGSGWADKPMPANVSYVGHVSSNDHNAFNSTPLAILNVNRDSMARIGFSPATRVFEAAGAGACVISDAWLGIELFLEPDREVLIAHEGREVNEHLEALTPKRARSVGAAARQRILAHHTYAARARLFEATVEGGAA